MSPRIEELTGIAALEFLADAEQFWRVVHEEDAESSRMRLKQFKTSADATASTFRVRNILTGRVSHLWERRQSVRNEKGDLLGYEGLWLDITSQAVAERRLMHMAWRENLGMLTSAIVHDLSNLMTGIITVSETLANESPQNDSLRSRAALIRSGAMQASELAQGIRRFHPASAGERNYHDLNQIVAQTQTLLQKVLSRRVKLQTDCCAGQLPVFTDAVELRQAIINLVLNAADAMPEGGALKLSTSRHERAPDATPCEGAFRSGPLACVSVRDTGTGIPSEFMDSIFDPYFTTKPLGKGAGLGLHFVRLFAEKNRAAVTLETAPGSGTVVHLWLPQNNPAETAQTSAGPTGKQTLLVAGIDAKRRKEMVRNLRAGGFYVADADSTSDALRKINSLEYQFSALLLLVDKPKDEELLFLRQLRAAKLPLKTFLCPRDNNQSEFNTSFLVNVDATLPHGSGEDYVAQIRKLLPQT